MRPEKEKMSKKDKAALLCDYWLSAKRHLQPELQRLVEMKIREWKYWLG